MSEEQKYPSLTEQGKNLARFSWDLIKHLQKGENLTSLFVSEEVYNERIKTCNSCEKYNDNDKRCTECGCYVHAKAKIVLDACPLNKWKVDDSNWETTFNEIVSKMENDTLDKTP